MMSSATFYRLSGLALVVAAPIGVIESVASGVLYPGHDATAQQMASVPWMVLAWLYFAGFLLVALGMPGMHRRQVARSRGWGRAGFILTLLGVIVGGVLLGLLNAVPSQEPAQTGTTAASQPPVILFLVFVTIPVLLIAGGAVVLGLASLRASVFPRGAAILLLGAGIVGLVSLAVPSSIENVLDPLWNAIFFVALGWFGAALLAKSTDDARTPERAMPVAQPSH